jgi:hypothetical protein
LASVGQGHEEVGGLRAIKGNACGHHLHDKGLFGNLALFILSCDRARKQKHYRECS